MENPKPLSNIDRIIDEIFIMKRESPYLELESRVTSAISNDQFKILAKRLVDVSNERFDHPETLDITFYTSNGLENLPIRYTITGLDNIRGYCKTENLPKNYTKLYKRQIAWKKEFLSSKLSEGVNPRNVTVSDRDFDIKVNLKSEIEPDELGNFGDRDAEKVDKDLLSLINRNGYSNIDKVFRFKKRTSFSHPAFPEYRIDLTIVKSNRKTYNQYGNEVVIPKKTFKDANVLNESESFEVEIEYIGKDELNSLSISENRERFSKCIHMILTFLYCKISYPHNFPSRSMRIYVIDKYISLIRKTLTNTAKDHIQILKEGISTEPYTLLKSSSSFTHSEMIEKLEKSIDRLEKGKGYYRVKDPLSPLNFFLGPKPVSMEIENVQKEYPINILKGYTVTDKADGETTLLFIKDGNVFLIDTNFNIDIIGTTDRTFDESLMIGEYVNEHFYCFDLYIYKGNDVRGLPLYHEERSRLQLAQKLIVDLDKQNIGLHLKKFYYGDDIFALTKQIWDAKESFPYRLDGVIYTPANEPVGFDRNQVEWMLNISSRWNLNMKWKPPQENTIDFLVKIEKDTFQLDTNVQFQQEKIHYLTRLEGGKSSFIPYKTIHLYCGFNYVGYGENIFPKYLATTFTPTNPYNPNAYIANIPCDENRGNHIFGIHDNQRILHNTIVEFSYDILKDANNETEEAFRWIPLRTRSEKTASYMKGLKEKEQLYNIYQKYTSTEYNAGYRWTPNEMRELRQISFLIHKFRLKPDGDIKNPTYIYATLNHPNNKAILEREIRSPLEIPTDINYGNNFETANSIWRSIHIPITEEMITTGLGIPSMNDMETAYYNRDGQAGREKSITRPLQEFHNKYIKNFTLYEIAVNTLRSVDPDIQIKLLDLATGKGGDLYKWYQKKIPFIVGIDNNNNNIYDGKDGANTRYIEFKKRMEVYGEKDIPKVYFLYGDISKNIISGDAMESRDSKNLGNKLWEDLTDGFDIVSIQFAIHYLFQNEGKLEGFLENISQNLKPGGILIGTCFDGATIYRHLYNKSIGSSISGSKDGQTIWKIKKNYENVGENIPNNSESIGLGIDVFIQSINQSITEYLVSWEYLKKRLENIHLEVVQTGLFDSIYDKFKGEIRFPLSPDEQKISFMNRYFILRKKSGLGINVDEIYDKLMSMIKNPQVNRDLSRGIKSRNWEHLRDLLSNLKIYLNDDEFQKLKEKLTIEHKKGNFVLEALRKPKEKKSS